MRSGGQRVTWGSSVFLRGSFVMEKGISQQVLITKPVGKIKEVFYSNDEDTGNKRD